MRIKSQDVEDNMRALRLHSKRREVPEREDIVLLIYLDPGDARRQASGCHIEVNFDVAVELESTRGLGEEEVPNDRQIQKDLNYGGRGVGVDGEVDLERADDNLLDDDALDSGSLEDIDDLPVVELHFLDAFLEELQVHCGMLGS
ncbi:hypothetical protein BDR05DRAFT_959700 [Suillus weaverae]|nr:hypothetical protein BDR05DRAFT_959700 [Suillus weaverae]